MKLNLLILILSACFISACAVEPKPDVPPEVRVIVQKSPPSEVDHLLEYTMQARKLNGREFAAERDQVRKVFQTQQTADSRMKLAVLLTFAPPSLAVTSASDDAELVMLLEPLIRNMSASEVGFPENALASEIRALAMLLHSLVQDRKKLRDQSREAQARLNALRRDDTREMEIRALRTRVDELEHKLAALKSIDRSVNRRSAVQSNESQRIESTK